MSKLIKCCPFILGLLRQAAQQMLMQEQKMTALRTGAMRVKDATSGPRIRQCEERFTQLVGDIFIGNEMVPDVIETPPLYPLELTYRSHGQRNFAKVFTIFKKGPLQYSVTGGFKDLSLPTERVIIVITFARFR